MGVNHGSETSRGGGRRPCRRRLVGSATIVDVLYTGTISTGLDVTGVFGVANTSLTGDSFSVSFVFDTTKGATSSSPDRNNVYASGNSSPALSAVITISGHSVSIGVPNYYGDIYGYSNGVYSEQFHEASRVTNGNISTDSHVTASISNSDATLPVGIIGPPTYTVKPPDTVGGFFQIDTHNNNTGAGQFAWGRLTPLTLTVSASVPEPSTWSMMLLGFVGLGLAARRAARRKVDSESPARSF
jgi:hypothetical protein